MSILGNIRLIISILVLIIILAVGGGLTYVGHSDEKAAAYALGTMAVDPKAGYLEQASQMAQGYSAANAAIEAAKTSDEEFSRRSADFVENRYGRPGETGSGDESASTPMDSADSEFAAD